MAADNKKLGVFQLTGIEPAPRGTPQIEVSFNIDANGILNVSAKDKATGKEQSITISDSGNLSKEDIAQAQKEAEAHADEDKQKKALSEARNQLDGAVYQAQGLKKEDGYDKVEAEARKSLEEAVAGAEEQLKKEDAQPADFEAAAKSLSEASLPVMTKLAELAKEGQEETAEAGADAKTEKAGQKATGKGEPVEGEIVEEDKTD